MRGVSLYILTMLSGVFLLGCTDEQLSPAAAIHGNWSMDSVVFNEVPLAFENNYQGLKLSLDQYSANLESYILNIQSDGNYIESFDFGQGNSELEGFWTLDNSTLTLDQNDYPFFKVYDVIENLAIDELILSQSKNYLLLEDAALDTLTGWTLNSDCSNSEIPCDPDYPERYNALWQQAVSEPVELWYYFHR